MGDGELGHPENIVEPLDGSRVERLGSATAGRSTGTATTAAGSTSVEATSATATTATAHAENVHDDLVETAGTEERRVRSVELMIRLVY